MKPRFFKTAAAFRAWLEKHHASATELWVGFYKRSSGKRGMSYLEAVEQALCYGWIDGIARSVDDASYMQRFTPRRKGSYWSDINIGRAKALIERGLMRPAGLAAFEAHNGQARGRYSNENRNAAFDAAMLKQFKANRKAWAWFEAQPPSFRRVAAHWVTGAKKPETRASRLSQLITFAERGERPKPFAVSSKAR